MVKLANAKLPGVITVVLVIVLGWQLASLVWSFVPGSPAGDAITAAPPPSSARVTPGGQTADVEAVANAHLFGEAKPEDVVAVPLDAPTEELEETRLALTLKGTMAGTDNRLTVAIISDSRNEEKVYTIGDPIVSGASLHAVYRDQVVLNRNGNLEALKLPKELPVSSAPRAAPGHDDPTRVGPRPAGQQRPGGTDPERVETRRRHSTDTVLCWRSTAGLPGLSGP